MSRLDRPGWARAYGMPADHVDKGRGGRIARAPFGAIQQERLKVGKLPSFNNISYSGQKHSFQTLVARYFPPGDERGEVGTFTRQVFVYSPTNRFRCEVRVVFEPDALSGVDPSFVVIPQWSLRAISRNPLTGREAPMQIAYPPLPAITANLPDGYEFDSAVQIARADITLSDTAFNAAYVPLASGCNVFLIATWEPNVDFTAELNDNERNRLYSLCSITKPEPLELVNNAGP